MRPARPTNRRRITEQRDKKAASATEAAFMRSNIATGACIIRAS